MRFALTVVFAFVFPLIIFSQKIKRDKGQVSKNGYVIRGKLLNGSNKKIYLIEVDSWNENGFRDSTTTDKQGKFTFRGKVKEPLMCRIEIANHAIDFYLENSLITIKGNADSIWSAKLTGSREESVRQEYQNKIWLGSKGGLIKDYGGIMADYKKAKGDSFVIKIVDKKKQAFFLKLEDSIKSLMVKHPFSLASVDEVSYFIDKHLNTDYNYSEPDSLLKVFEESMIGHYHQIAFLRKRINSYKSLSIGNFAPEFSQEDTSGNKVSLSSYKGKYVLLDFWASWCEPCRAQNPNLVKLYALYKNKNFTIVSISLDETRKAWLDAIYKDNLLWTNLSDLKGRQNEIALQYGVNGIPFNLLLAPTGKIISINITDEELIKKLKQLP